MTQTDSKPKALLWCPGEHLAAMMPTLKRAGWSIVGLGMPPRTSTEALPDLFGETPKFDDARVAVREAGADIALFVDVLPLDDDDLLSLCHENGVRVLSLGPSPDGVHNWTKARTNDEQNPRIVPLLADSVIHADTVEALEPWGQPVGASIRMTAPAILGGVPSRLYDAMHLAHTHFGVPEQIDASCPGVKATSSLTLRSLAGNVHAHLRYPSAGVTIAITDAVRTLKRDAALQYESGIMRLTDHGFVMIDPEGNVSDSTKRDGVDPLVEQLKRAADPRLPGPVPHDRSTVLAMCEALVLSVRTRQPERPHELLEMMGG